MKDIDRPIRDVIKRLNELGYQTKFSCCGYKYPRQRGRKLHGWPYVTFYASFNKVKKLFDLVKKTDGRVWSIDFEGGSTRRAYWKIYHFPVYIFPRGKKYTDQCKIAWNQVREILEKL